MINIPGRRQSIFDLRLSRVLTFSIAPTRCDKEVCTGDNPHLMHQLFVSTAPSPTGIVTFPFSEPCGDKLMVTTLLVAPPYPTENLIGVSDPMLKPPQFPGTAGTIKKYLHCTIARLFHRYPRRWGGGGGGIREILASMTDISLVVHLHAMIDGLTSELKLLH